MVRNYKQEKYYLSNYDVVDNNYRACSTQIAAFLDTTSKLLANLSKEESTASTALLSCPIDST